MLVGVGGGDDVPGDAAVVAAGALDDDLRRRVVDATDPVDDVPALDEALAASGSSVAPLSCVDSAGVDAAARQLCAVDGLVAMLLRDGQLDPVTASCAAAAIVDELGTEAVLDALRGGDGPPDLRDRLRTAFADC